MRTRAAAPRSPRRSHRGRLDHLVVARDLAPSRHQAEAAIRAGEIFVDSVRTDKPGTLVAPSAVVERRARGGTYVSRGGVKLEGALDAFGVRPADLTALDVGSSTGGFTDCLLQRGARRVYAVDVGRGLLHWKLRRDPRVVVLEGRHAARLQAGDIPEPIDLATVDCSFISLAKVLPTIATLLRDGGLVLALVKPQFEAGPKAAPRGVVRDQAVHADVLRRAVRNAATLGLAPIGVTASVLRGPQGNREFFLLARRGGQPAQEAADDLDEAVNRAVRGDPSGGAG